ncbi:unnamed protein product [Rhizoctonia solani]|uniref:NACHT domain-containing protein n=1 Tax=Rhizoctonia solani TaxID=456999 RepID=A0A8H3HRZ8_9AGAM|nr:unnamed protein product [Rhizoctonia solani]
MPNKLFAPKRRQSGLSLAAENPASSVKKPRPSPDLGAVDSPILTTPPEALIEGVLTSSLRPGTSPDESTPRSSSPGSPQPHIHQSTSDFGQPGINTSPHLSSSTLYQRPSRENAEVSSDKKTKAAGVGWRALEKAMRALHISAEAIPPVHSAVGGFVACLDHFEAARRNREEYDQVVAELGDMATYLSQYLNSPRSQVLTERIAEIAEMIETEIEDVHRLRDWSKATQVLKAMDLEQDLVRRFRRIGELFRRIQMETSMSEWSAIKEALVNKRLEKLKPVMLAQYNSRIADAIGRRSCTDDTRQEILSEIEQWCDDPNGSVFYWMNGMAGTGKTTIAYTLSNKLAARGQLGASFFCTVASDKCRDASNIIPTVAYQLARQSTPYRAALTEGLELESEATDLSISEQLKYLLVNPLKTGRNKLARNLVIVIDALDECRENTMVRVLLNCLFDSAGQLPIKCFITSRPEPGIYERLAAQSDDIRSVLHLHEVSQESVQQDIRMYLREGLTLIEPSDEEVERLTALSGRLFIYAATAVRYIAPDDPSVNSNARLKTMLDMNSTSTKKQSAIDALYSAILTGAVANSEPEERDSIMWVVWATVCSRHPVSFDGLVVLAGIGDEAAARASLASLRSLLHVSLTNNTVSTFHASFPQFILDQIRSGDFSCQLNYVNHTSAVRCLRVFNTQPSCTPRPDKPMPPYLTFAGLNWSGFLDSEFHTDPEELYGELREFFTNQFDNWAFLPHGEPQDIANSMGQLLLWLMNQNVVDEPLRRAAQNTFYYGRANEVGRQLLRQEAMKRRANISGEPTNKCWIWDDIGSTAVFRILKDNPLSRQ